MIVSTVSSKTQATSPDVMTSHAGGDTTDDTAVPRVVHNPTITIPLVNENGNPNTFVLIRVNFESSGKKVRLGNPVTF